MTPWRPIDSAPRDGRPVEIMGLRYMTEESYTATAVWTTRRCPDHAATGWCPATDVHDGQGDYGDVTHWREIKP